MRLNWIETKFDRGARHEAATPFGTIIIVDDGYRCMCIQHPLKAWTPISSPLTLSEVKHQVETYYFASILREWEKR